MARKRDPRRNQAFNIWEESGGKKDLVEIAAELGVPAGTVRGWKNKDKWEHQLNGTFPHEVKKTERSHQNTERSETKVTKAENGRDSHAQNEADDKPIELTERQRMFVDQFLIDFNATQAAIRAGYSETTARKQAHRLLANVGIRKKIAELLPKLRERMAEDSRAAYFALWEQLHKIDQQIAMHEEAEEKLREVEESHLHAMVNGPDEEEARLRHEKYIYMRRIMKPGSLVKLMELRASILQDILDRGGFKPLDLLADDPDKLKIALNKDRREEEKLAIERERLQIYRQKNAPSKENEAYQSWVESLKAVADRRRKQQEGR